MWDFVMDKSGAGASFLAELLFPLPIYIPSASPQSCLLSHEAGTIGQEWPHSANSLTNQIIIIIIIKNATRRKASGLIPDVIRFFI
jgi:hypothetical protein